MSQIIISLDQGTTNSRALAIDEQGEVVGMASRAFEQFYPQQGWVEHDAMAIWASQQGALREVIEGLPENSEILALGITNQRETVLAWDKITGVPYHKAIVWQDQRTIEFCKEIKEKYGQRVKSKTGLVVDTYFSASKMKWMLDNVPAVKEAAACDRLAFGNIDSWLIWKLTNGAIHATDASNACRTMLFNIHEHKWDTDLIEMFDIPKSALPEVKDSNGDFGIYQNGSLQIPIRAVLGDQQSALFGQLCWNEGEIKNTYGTGCFMLMNTGSEVAENANLLASVAWCKSSEVTYCLEGSVFIAGAAMQWLRDELMIIDNIENSHHIASSAVDKDLVVVPAFAGLGAPHWDMDARGAIFGLTRDINRQDIIKATLESIAFQSADLLEEMKLGDHGIGKVRVDGGAAANDYLMQFQSDLMQIEIERPKNIESTAMGVAYMAGMAVGLWTENQLSLLRAVDENYTPKRSQAEVQKIKSAWLRAVNALKSWSENG